jgi:hypothetical protein
VRRRAALSATSNRYQKDGYDFSHNPVIYWSAFDAKHRRTVAMPGTSETPILRIMKPTGI